MSRNTTEDPVQLPFQAPTSSFNQLKRSSSFNQQHGRPRIVTPPDSSLGNLNRWSKSTASSSHSHKRSNSFSLAFSKQDTSSTHASPSKLQKRRPSISGAPATQIRINPPKFDPTNLPLLPPINTLPNLQTSIANGSSPLTGPYTPSPSTAQVLSALPKTVPDYFAAWDEQAQDFSHRRAHSRSRSANRDPSPNPAFIPAYTSNGPPVSRGHSRHRSQTAKSSTGTTSTNRSSKQPSQKAMLSKALQKANTAVLLDNAQNFEGAMQAYSEACALLQQVMARSSGDDDRRKLEAIRNTYTSRINELMKIAPHLRDDGKALPARPESGEYRGDEPQSQDDEDEDHVIYETATVTRIVNDQSYVPEHPNRSIQPSEVPRRRESLMPSPMEYGRGITPDSNTRRAYSKSPMREHISETNINLAPPMESLYMPPPLSPRRPLSPVDFEINGNVHERQHSSELTVPVVPGFSPIKGHKRAPSNESMSWLDTIDESGGSAVSSIHSRSSSVGLRRKHIRAPSGATEAEFDAALDAAVEAAYDDGYEPDEPEVTRYDYVDDDEIVANVRRKVELAKERVRQSEREAAIQDALDRERRRLLEQQNQQREHDFDDEYDENESEEEERMLEEMTRGYVMDDFEFGLQSKSALPRESDSSGFSGRTWSSSLASNSNLTTAGTSLSTVAEFSVIPQVPALQSKSPPPIHPPPSQALPLPPPSHSLPSPPSQALSSPPTSQILPPPPSQALPPTPPTQMLPPPPPASAPPPALSQSVRSRRLSGQNAKQLKIETATKASPTRPPPPTQPPSMPPPRIPGDVISGQPKSAGLPLRQTQQSMMGRATMNQSARQASSPFPGPNSADISPPTPNLTQVMTNDSDTQLPRSGSPARAQSRTGLRKNFSSSSLKNLKGRNLSVSGFDDGSDVSPNTPMTSQFTTREPNGKVPAIPTLPTPIAAAFKEKMNGASTGGLYLFNSDLQAPDSPGTQSQVGGNAPIPLEPCPTEFLLRPFWLMRALYQTIAHPRGGYVSTKLFVPRDVWRVKGVKLKCVEDKIANCDFLTAALLKLAQVDTYDADAVLEEMQQLEGVLEQVQAVLTKKLGNEVGVQGSGGMFKDAGADAENGAGPKSANSTSKSSSFSWRRLRTKNSAVGLTNNYSNKTPADVPKDGLVMATLPMTTTSLAKVRFSKRDVSQLQFAGPHANYMSSLARLFDAAQTLDQIARQVEDPGLRHADKTQVGLELCTRHAAEFFGFYICRFVLNDIGLLLDKFIKRGSEWVLA